MFRKSVILVMLLISLWISIAFHGLGSNPFGYDSQQEYIRFHVLANSDTPEDQELKYQLKDMLIPEISKRFTNSKSLSETRRILKENLLEIGQISQESLQALGSDYSIKVQYGWFSFPTKYYNYRFSLPAGDYEAVRVVIGEGQGANWWCVLFPPLCFVNTDDAVPVLGTDNEQVIPIRFSLKILDWLVDIWQSIKDLLI